MPAIRAGPNPTAPPWPAATCSARCALPRPSLGSFCGCRRSAGSAAAAALPVLRLPPRAAKLTRDDLRHHLTPVDRVPRGRRPAPADLARPGRIRRRRRGHRPLRRGVDRALRDAEPEPERRRRPGLRAGEPAPAGGRLRRGPRRFRLRPPGARRRRPRRGRGRPGERRVLARRRHRQCRRGRPGRRGRRAGHHLTRGGARDPDRGLRADRAARPGGRRARLRARGLARHRGRGDRRGPGRHAGPGLSPVRRHRRDRPRHRRGPLPGRPRRARGRHPAFGPAAAGSSAPTRRLPAAGCSTSGPPTATPSARPASPAPRSTPPTIPTGPVPGHFFSDRTARPCGRLALVARLRPGGAR